MVEIRYVSRKWLALKVFVDIQGVLGNGNEVFPDYSAVLPACERVEVLAEFLLQLHYDF